MTCSPGPLSVFLSDCLQPLPSPVKTFQRSLHHQTLVFKVDLEECKQFRGKRQGGAGEERSGKVGPGKGSKETGKKEADPCVRCSADRASS